MNTCKLCQRSGEDEYFEEHHLYPGRKRRKKVDREYDTITVCTQCGDQIHTMFDNTELRTNLDSLEKLQEAMHSYIRWVQKRDLTQKKTGKLLKKKR